MALQYEALFEAPASHEASHYSNPELENEWETNHHSNPESAQEGEFFFKKAFRSIGRGIKSAAKVLGPLAKRLAPMLGSKLLTFIPGVGPIVGPLAGQLIRVVSYTRRKMRMD